MHTIGSGIEFQVVDSLAAVPGADWDALVDENDPFLTHAFLLALEASGSVGAAAGWRPRFVLARRAGALVGGVPLYLKDNSHGEFVFDWGWADAAARAGLAYYPKLVAAVPFTPVTGNRLLFHPGETGAGRASVAGALVAGMRAVADESGASSIHVLFCTQEESAALSAQGFATRLGFQFHWRNREPEPYRDFDDYLGDFRSRHRKQTRREREIANSHGLDLVTKTGAELDATDWRALQEFYRANAGRHGAITYLTPRFFEEASRTLAPYTLATLAYRGATPIAGTLNFERGRHLYGRYWGATEEKDSLHFELCYHRLIERAIAREYARVEAGAQGEHKLKRGMPPELTYSAHWIRDQNFARAVQRFVTAEADAVRQQMRAYQKLSPFSAPC